LGRISAANASGARDVVDHHRMCPELLVEVHVRALGEKIEVELGQDGGKAIGVLDLDLALAVAGTQAIAPRAVRRAALEQSDVVDALEAAFVALLIHDRDPLGVRKEDAHERHVAFDMGAEIAERVGVATFDHGVCLWRERAHSGVSSERVRMRQVPASGTRSQSGRCASS
jgi:hypothetical protein